MGSSAGMAPGSGSVTSASSSRKRGCSPRWATLAARPVAKLSSAITSWPCARRLSQRCEPMNPAPPATRMRTMRHYLTGLKVEGVKVRRWGTCGASQRTFAPSHLRTILVGRRVGGDGDERQQEPPGERQVDQEVEVVDQ